MNMHGSCFFAARGLALTLALAGISQRETVAQTTVTAGSAAGIAKSVGANFNQWKWFGDPGPTTVITWTSGINTTDGVAHPKILFGPELKFDLGPPIDGRNFVGFTRLDGPGPFGSTASTEGEGRSLAVPGMVYGTNYSANWRVEASGAKGSGPNASWSSTASAFDPYSITPAQLQFANVVGPAYDLFFTASVEAGSYSPRGRIIVRALYEVAGSITSLLTITIDDGNVDVAVSLPSGGQLWRLNSIDEGPIQDTSRLLNAASLRSTLLNDVGLDRSIDVPVYIGIMLNNIPVPTVDLGDGSVAKLRIESFALDGEGGPPSAVANVTMDAGTISWSPDMAGAVYDVVLGDLGSLRMFRSHTPAILGCLENNSFDPHSSHVAAIPGAGAAFYYLVRAANGLGVGTYGSAATDAQIAGSPVTCP